MFEQRLRGTALLLGLLLAAGCGGDADGEPATEGAAGEPPVSPEETAPVSPGDVDAELAARGEEIFQSRGCNACHSLGSGRLVGPDLQGVAQRREQGWIIAMIMNPDSMLQADETARGLFDEYMTPMADQNLSDDEANALYEFLRVEGSE
jgi:mono/diheme cytochrome c family protein